MHPLCTNEANAGLTCDQAFIFRAAVGEGKARKNKVPLLSALTITPDRGLMAAILV